MTTRILGIALLWLVLSGFCEGQSTDPRQGGYFAGVCGLSNGAYERRLENREDVLDRLDQTAQTLQSRLRLAKRDRHDLERDIVATRARIDADRRAIADLDAELQRRRESRALADAEIASLKAEKEAIEAEYFKVYEEAAKAERAIRYWRDRGSNVELDRATREQSRDAAAEIHLRDGIDALRRRLDNRRIGSPG